MPRSRTRRIAKWTGRVSCILLLTLLLIGNWWSFWWYGTTGGVELGKGGLHAAWWSAELGVAAATPLGWDADLHAFDVRRWSFDYLPSGEFQPFGWLMIPLSPILLAIAIPTAWLWHRDRRHPPGHCRKCGYNLKGNVTGVCSECGGKFERD